MKRVLGIAVALALFLGVGSTTQAAAPSRQFPYVKQTALAPGAYKFVFSLYASPTAPTPLWSSGAVSLTLKTPVLVYTLGSGAVGIPATIDFSQQLYLKVVKSSPAPVVTVVNRERLPIAPYAVRSGVGGQAVCLPGDFVNCYEGPPGTLGVGPCWSGRRFCSDAGSYLATSCVGQILPLPENCDGADRDCDGLKDASDPDCPCPAGLGDCNGSRSDGCETSVASDPENCGGCGLVCSSYHLVSACIVGVCAGVCDPDWGDCNNDKGSDGCETDLGSDSSNCGVCGQVCAPGQTCQGGTCASLLPARE